jgi:predicted Fe-Mo cluster-binding NifX family protein
MKVAAVTEDGTTISQHFGRAPKVLVVVVEDGKIVDRLLREKAGHDQFAGEPHPEHAGGGGHGQGPMAGSRHARMIEAFADCEALFCGGMGQGAYEAVKARGIRPFITEIEGIDEAVQAYVAGSLVDRIERLH